MRRMGALLLERCQPLGRALMLPIAVLPIAALLLRLGQPDMLDIGFVAAAGDAIFANLGLLFAIGVAVGLARENHGAAGLAGVVCFLVATKGAEALLDAPAGLADVAAWKAKEIAKLSVPAGIVSGVTAGTLYNRFAAIQLPAYLGFFAGRRFVPIVSGCAGILLAAVFGTAFPWFEAGVDTLSRWVVTAGPLGLFVYGLLNRLLLVTGLHHILNNIAWFLIGDFHGATGDLKRFFAGDPSAGGFMAGFFPVMMFGLPAACLAMYRAAAPGRRKSVAGLYLSLALTAFLTGVTEPIEFSFLFLAPALFLVHAVLTGVAMVVMALLGVKLGFGFSAGLLDYVLNFGLATRPLLLLPIGLAYAALYYVVFGWCIRRFDLKTPGRDAEAAALSTVSGDRAAAMIAALGGRDNLLEIAACTTRLRLVVQDQARVADDTLRSLGARGVVRLARGAVQVVIGTEADQLATEMRSHRGQTTARTAIDLPRMRLALEPAGVTRIERRGQRVIALCTRPEAADLDALRSAGALGVTRTPSAVHLLAEWSDADTPALLPANRGGQAGDQRISAA
ncbi:N-acetylglucosamine-specific PTS transporter subunit IIBC [Sphingomonas jatrophae]|uniref:PTS system N-acetylglucosamine-specific IIB component, Glc family /PTS system N-acetylglucosamine-specific IIC component, Glc family n=1 Tax=Sphingomonas jatrophae TaxID=1166337 RepID=A0A1I6K8Z8_9SPHN|nr:N-acetylglucosamine-specific PTS transporter subunit IIBC [Sphingomonas jatrophae]SFR87692.1 PTS system N-acetylglucosamine-specific IIB component, Glc family /PTS system N-acetylglucosamine-specific IIC component, Glc family [Sphingomonas jatrophae]